METAQAENKHKAIDIYIEKLGLNYGAIFVPQSKSRNAGEKNPSLNWSVTVAANYGNPFKNQITTDYMQGIGCAPKDSFYAKNPRLRDKMFMLPYIEAIVEQGKYAKLESQFHPLTKIPAPALRDVLYSLVMDSDVLNSPCFEDWASEYGYETDSRQSEKVYNDCLKIALKLRALIGDKALNDLRELFQEY